MKTELKFETRLGRLALSVIIGAVVTLGLLWLIAWAVGHESLPDEYLSVYAGGSLLVGSVVAGACAPVVGGKRLRSGLAVGGALALILIISKLLAETTDIFGIQTGISMLLCLGGGMAGSCIFHKRLQRNTRSKKQRKRRR